MSARPAASALASPRAAPTSSAVAAARSGAREPIVTSMPASTSRRASAEPNAPVPPSTATSHATTAPSAASASRFLASGSVISVRVTIGRTSPSPSRSSASASSTTSASMSPGYCARHVGGGRTPGEARQHPVGRPPDRAAADQRADGDCRNSARRERSSDRLDGEDRPDRHVRVARRDEQQLRLLERVEDAGCGRRFAFEADGVDLVAVTARDEPLLERELAGRCLDPGAQPVIGRGQDVRLDPQRSGQPFGDARERLSRTQRLRADEVEPQVEVAELEPGLAAEPADRLERAPGLLRAPPAALLVVQSGERVEDRVEIGRDVKPEHLDVVADVADHRDVTRIAGVDQPPDESRAANAARQNDDPHAFTRSAGVSTSSRRPGRTTSAACSTCARKRAALSGP